jgi:glycosyltransferase involved in cell wall biosynthesis
MSNPTLRRLTILEVSEPNKDGVFIHVRGLLRRLLKSGHALIYAYSDKRAASQLEGLLAELDEAAVATKNIRVGSAPCLGDIRAIIWILWVIHTRQPDVVHGHSSKAGALIRLAAMLLPGPAYIYTPHAYYSMSERPKGLRIGYWWLERAMASLATTINISRDERRFAVEQLKLDEAQATIAPNPVDLTKFTEIDSTSRARLREHWGVHRDAIVFGVLARFGKQKDLGTFYDAAIRCAKDNSRVHFMHLGAGKEIESLLDKTAQNGVRKQFTHIEYMEDTAPFYACLDCFVLTSRFEAGWPIVMLEALALGLPVVTTDFVGLRANDPADLTHAAVVPVGDVDCVADALVRMAAILTSGQPLSTNHRAYVETHFPPEVCYGKVEQLYRSLTPADLVV